MSTSAMAPDMMSSDTPMAPVVSVSPSPNCSATIGASAPSPPARRKSQTSRPRKRLSWSLVHLPPPTVQETKIPTPSTKTQQATGTAGDRVRTEGFFELKNSTVGQYISEIHSPAGCDETTTTKSVTQKARPLGDRRIMLIRSMSFTNGVGHNDGDPTTFAGNPAALTDPDGGKNTSDQIAEPLQGDPEENPEEYEDRRHEVRAVKRIKSEPTFVTLAALEEEETATRMVTPSQDEASEKSEEIGLCIEGATDSGAAASHPVTIDRKPNDELGANHVKDVKPPEGPSMKPQLKPLEPLDGLKPPHPSTVSPSTSPDDYIRLLVKAYLGYVPSIRQTLSLPESYFPPLDETHLASYTTEVVAAVRENDLEQIRALHRGGHGLACCNRFGESLLHMTCRRGYTQAFRYLVDEADVGVRIRDDCGRTPLHDACWNRFPQHDIVEGLLEKDAVMLLMSDKRGASPFAYARVEDWGGWRSFLWERREVILRGLDGEKVRELFGGKEL